MAIQLALKSMTLLQQPRKHTLRRAQLRLQDHRPKLQALNHNRRDHQMVLHKDNQNQSNHNQTRLGHLPDRPRVYRTNKQADHSQRVLQPMPAMLEIQKVKAAHPVGWVSATI